MIQPPQSVAAERICEVQQDNSEEISVIPKVVHIRISDCFFFILLFHQSSISFFSMSILDEVIPEENEISTDIDQSSVGTFNNDVDLEEPNGNTSTNEESFTVLEEKTSRESLFYIHLLFSKYCFSFQRR